MMSFLNCYVKMAKEITLKGFLCMSNSNSLREEIKKENKKMKDMTFSQKTEHIWEYYKVHIIAVIVVIAVVVSMVVMFNINHYKTVFTTLVIDGYMDGFDDHSDMLTTDFTQYLGVNGTSERVLFNNNFSLIQRDGDQDAYYSQEKIIAMAATRSIDGYMCERDYVDFFSDDDELFLTDLTTVLTAEELQTISSADALVYYTTANGEKIPFAVDLSNTHIKTDTDLYMDDPCYGIVTTSPNVENAVKFIRYAFEL